MSGLIDGLKTPERLTAGAVFPFEECDGRVVVRLDLGQARFTAMKCQCDSQFFKIDTPVAARFDPTTERDEKGKHGMGMETSLEVARFWLRVGIEQIVLSRAPVGLIGQAPEVDQISAYQQAVRRRVVTMSRQAVGGAVDADHQMIGMLSGQFPAAVPGAATGIQDQWLAFAVDSVGHLVEGN